MTTMRSAFVEDKDFRDLYASFILLFGKRYIQVFIWKSVRGLRRNTSFQDNNYLGAYLYYPNRKARTGLFGEIHLLKRMIGAGYVAHEIQHFLFDWLLQFQSISGRHNEQLAYLAGETTKEFWNSYYELEDEPTGRKQKSVTTETD